MLRAAAGGLHFRINYLHLCLCIDKSKTMMSRCKDTGSTNESSAVFKNDASSDVDNDKKECETTFNDRK